VPTRTGHAARRGLRLGLSSAETPIDESAVSGAREPSPSLIAAYSGSQPVEAITRPWTAREPSPPPIVLRMPASHPSRLCPGLATRRYVTPIAHWGDAWLCPGLATRRYVTPIAHLGDAWLCPGLATRRYVTPIAHWGDAWLCPGLATRRYVTSIAHWGDAWLCPGLATRRSVPIARLRRVCRAVTRARHPLCWSLGACALSAVVRLEDCGLLMSASLRTVVPQVTGRYPCRFVNDLFIDPLTKPVQAQLMIYL